MVVNMNMDMNMYGWPNYQHCQQPADPYDYYRQHSFNSRDDDLGSLSSGSGCNRSSREMRNLAEKKRRDTLNTHINKLSTLVPMVASSGKKMDKTSVLRLSATYLRMNKTLIPDKNWPHLAQLLEAINLSKYLMEGMEGFLLIVTAAARIIFVSHTIEKHLGHSQYELMGQDLYSIVHEEDHDDLKRNLTPDGGFPCCPGGEAHGADDSSSSESVTSCSSGHSSPGPPPDLPSSTSDSLRDTPMERQRRSFYIRMSQKGSPRTDQREYEHVHIVGDLRVPSRLEMNIPPTRTRRPKECRYKENDIVLVAVGRLFKGTSVTDLSLLEATKEEYITKHEPTGRMTHIDHRISIVAGYMSEEVRGQSAFNYMHIDDVAWTMIALKQMYDKGEGCGSSTYRLLAKNGEYVYLRTVGYLEFNQNAQMIESFVCVNTLITKEEGEKGIEEMKKRYSPHFAAAQPKLLSITDASEKTLALQKFAEDLLSSVRTDRVSSSSEIAVRPTVLREVASVQRVSSSTGDKTPLKRQLEDSPGPRKSRRHSTALHVDVDIAPRSQDILDLDLGLDSLSSATPTIQVSQFRSLAWKNEMGNSTETILQVDTHLQTRQHIPSQTGKSTKKNAKPLMKTSTQVQQEMEHILCKTKRGLSNVSF